MVKKSTLQVAPQEQQKKPTDTGESLQEIVAILHRIERRDRVRTWGSLLRSTLGLLPLVIFLWSLYYVYQNGEALMKQIIRETVSQTASFTPDSDSGFLKELERLFPKDNSQQ